VKKLAIHILILYNIKQLETKGMM